MEAIKPHQIINYDAGIVLISHQLNVKTARQYKSATLNTGQPHVNEEQNHAEQQPATSGIPNQMIEQINIALEQKGSVSQPGSLKPAVRPNVRKESISIN